jgi:hypothetical protein
MGCLIDRKVQIIFVTASSVKDNGKKRKIVIESRPEFAIVRLTGATGEFPISWEMIYEAAMRHHAKNLQLEAEADKHPKPKKRRLAG